jgi:hypothetical protein
VGDLDPARRGGRLDDRGGGHLDPLGRRWRGRALARAVLEVRAALVLDVAEELGVLGVLAVGGGAGEPANHVLEAGARADLG